MISVDEFDRLRAGGFVSLKLTAGPQIEGYAGADSDMLEWLRINGLCLENDVTVARFSMRLKRGDIENFKILEEAPTVSGRNGVVHRVERSLLTDDEFNRLQGGWLVELKPKEGERRYGFAQRDFDDPALLRFDGFEFDVDGCFETFSTKLDREEIYRVAEICPPELGSFASYLSDRRQKELEKVGYEAPDDCEYSWRPDADKAASRRNEWRAEFECNLLNMQVIWSPPKGYVQAEVDVTEVPYGSGFHNDDQSIEVRYRLESIVDQMHAYNELRSGPETNYLLPNPNGVID